MVNIAKTQTKVKFFTGREYLMIPREAMTTYAKKHQAVMRMMELGGIHAPYTLEVEKLMKNIRSANRKIEREGWYSTSIKG